MTRTLSVEGMGCDGCETIVESALSNVDGVTDVTADQMAGTAAVEGDPEPEALVESLELAGYGADLEQA